MYLHCLYERVFQILLNQTSIIVMNVRYHKAYLVCVLILVTLQAFATAVYLQYNSPFFTQRKFVLRQVHRWLMGKWKLREVGRLAS